MTLRPRLHQQEEIRKQDLKNLETHLPDTGYFALEEEGDQIARLIHSFLGRTLN